MRNIAFDPFVVELPVLGATVLRDTDQVADILSNHWHGHKGPLYMLAVQISMEHMLAKRLPHEVRHAVWAAADEAGFPISHEDPDAAEGHVPRAQRSA